MILAGSEDEDQQAFAIQKEFLCSQSSYFRKYFYRSGESLETVIKFPDVTPDTFGFVQNFLFTREVYPSIEHLPSYEILINVWKVGHDLDIEGLCEKALEAMQKCRQITQHIPATPLLVQVWNETPKGSSIRQLLLSWAAEYMRSSEARAEFANSLPKEVLSELVVAMSELDMATPVPVDSEPPFSAHQNKLSSHVFEKMLSPPPPPGPATSHKNVHYLAASDPDEQASDGEYDVRVTKKTRRTSQGSFSVSEEKRAGTKTGSRPSLLKVAKRRSNAANSLRTAQDFPTTKKLEFCTDLLNRMLSGPGKQDLLHEGWATRNLHIISWVLED